MFSFSEFKDLICNFGDWWLTVLIENEIGPLLSRGSTSPWHWAFKTTIFLCVVGYIPVFRPLLNVVYYISLAVYFFFLFLISPRLYFLLSICFVTILFLTVILSYNFKCKSKIFNVYIIKLIFLYYFICWNSIK